ncbi:C6 transcription factor [Aspergillus nomiae NRRL 13137]|uniref:C6 transcription factor n=1 Tax=Aspergillus nomiae NRRL (strain ATCC 15546 / NRRL 13137 / CBS 260.88 / M93) TaxID=1509407 RepID=A0A0L1IVW2_ASPN3|nr:C6 transcription factor [Aspergillus nomiae NRRL 13137]KNG83634.1 C6 transcription factor [Aspergillus nomiae NRRL 13137]
MEPPLVEKRRPTSHQVCDNCHSRKVRCDRKNPCGNCQDQGTTCTRHRSMRRTMRKISRQSDRPSNATKSSRTSTHTVPELGSLRGLLDQQTDAFSLPSEADNDSLPMEMPEVGPILTNRPHMAYELHNWISIVPLTDAQMASRHRLSRVQGLAWNRLQVLESALYAASQFTESMGGFKKPLSIDDQSEEQRKIPAPEFLTWMLKDIGTDLFGPYVRDYFRHVSKQSLEKMGMALIRKDASPSDTILYTVCVNSIAYKFLTTVVMTEEHGELSQWLWHNALQYRATAQAALRKIPLVTTPSLPLLQAVLCGIFLFQGSGDTNFCWELTRTACRICTDIGLSTSATNGRAISEEEFFCFIWCYMLDRNYAWKLGRSKGFLEATPGGILHASSRLNPPVSELLLLYLDLAQIQDGIIPFIKDPSSAEGEAVPPVTDLREQLMPRMEDIRSRIDKITTPSDRWKGLDTHSEIAALDFAYHSVMTTILHLIQLTPGQTLTAKDLYLDSARQELSALVSICLSANKQSTVAFLHWTLLYYPLTAVFVLFCNAVVTSHIGDFNLLKTVADCLTQSGTASEHIANLQKLFQEFVSLSQRFLNEESSTALAAQTSPAQQGTSCQDVIHDSNSPHWLNTSSTWSTGILAGLDNHSFDPSFPMLELSYGDSTFFLGGGADMQPFSSA